jgi:hypothetical protein
MNISRTSVGKSEGNFAVEDDEDDDSDEGEIIDRSKRSYPLIAFSSFHRVFLKTTTLSYNFHHPKREGWKMMLWVLDGLLQDDEIYDF